MVPFLVAAFLATTAVADADPKVRELAEAVQRLDHRAPDLLQQLEAAYKKKCPRKTGALCTLSEAEFYAGAKPGRVLLFRGEPKVYPDPGVSTAFYDGAVREAFCKGCDNEAFAAALFRRVGELLNARFDTYRSTSCYLDSRDGTWKASAVGQHLPAPPDYVPVAALPPAKRPLHDAFTALGFLTAVHVSGGGASVLDAEGKEHPLDAMVSFTTDPAVAEQFAHKSGRILVLAVDASAIRSGEGSCDLDAVPPRGALFSAIECPAWADSYSDEAEVDAPFLVDPSLLRDSFLLN